MSQAAENETPREKIPSVRDAVLFRAKAALFQLQRSARDHFVAPVRVHTQSAILEDKSVLAVSSSALWTQHNSSERDLLAGKIENLRLAVRKLNGVEVAAGEVFSFWKHIGRPSQRRGYVKGRELRQGCIIPTTGGGLCQLSNALYSAALDAGFEIIERHAHTQIIAGSLAEQGRDATVFWNYVDLRFKSRKAFRIEAFLTADALVLRLKGEKASLSVLARAGHGESRAIAHNACASCGVESCFRNYQPTTPQSKLEPTAYLVDECWPEFDEYIQANKTNVDVLCIPLDGQRWNKSNYAWSKSGFRKINSATLATLRRAYDSRKLASQGAERQKNLLKHDEALAKQFASHLSYEMTRLCVSQNLLPFLWREGHLGGRSFDVLMTRLPIEVLQERLDWARELHPQSLTLGDFRSDESLVEAESEALQYAERIVTPHTEIASLFADKAILIDWRIPKVKPSQKPGYKVLFPASTLGRKGAYEMREATRELGFELIIPGKELEGENFWQGIAQSKTQDQRFDEVCLVVLPAFVEHQPRVLLQAVARGIPVIASAACGLKNSKGVTTIPTADVEALAKEIKTILTALYAVSAA
jgi:hypothetical protein